MHGTIRRVMAEFKKGNRLPFEEVQRLFETEWSAAGFEDDYQEGEYKKDGLEQLRALHDAVLLQPPKYWRSKRLSRCPSKTMWC